MTTLPAPTVDPLVDSFLMLEASSWSAAARYNARATLTRVHHWLAERGATLATATPTLLATWQAERLASGLAPATVISDRTRLRSFYAWAATDPDGHGAYITPNPMLRVKAPKGRDPEPSAVPECEAWQYQALMATCVGRRTRDGAQRALDRRDAAMLALLWHTGMRRGELVGIHLEHVDWSTSSIHLARTKARTASRSRTVYVAPEALDVLTRYLHERGTHDGPLFESIARDGTLARLPLRSDSVRLMLERRCKLATVAQGLAEPLRVSAHSFRRAYASAWLSAEGQQVTLETHMGWKHDGRMAARYTGASQSRLAQEEAARVAQARTAARRSEGGKRARRLRAVS